MRWLVILLISLFCYTGFGFSSKYYFSVYVRTVDYNPYYTAHCNARGALINVTGSHITKVVRSDAAGRIWLPVELNGYKANIDLLEDNFQQSQQRCYTNSWLWKNRVVVLQCWPVF